MVTPGYKQTEVGEIPEDWEIVALADAVEFWDGKRKPVKATDRAKMKGLYPYYGASGIVDYVNDYLFDDDLIPLGEDGENILSRNQKLAFIISGKTWVNNHAHVLKPKDEFIIKYLCEFLESLDYILLNSGTAQPKLNKQTCKKILIAKPNCKEQKAIAKALSDIDDLIVSLEKLIAKKQDIKTAAMQQLLTGKKRLPGFGEGKGYKQTEWGKIPEDWDLFQLDSISNVIDPHPSHRAPFAANIGIPFLGIGDFDEQGNIIKNDYRVVDSEIYKQHLKRYNLNDGLLGLGRVASIGKVIRLKSDIGKYTISPTLGIIQPLKSHYDFLYYMLNSKLIKNQFNKIISGSTRSSVGMNVLRKLWILCPTHRTETEKIGSIFKSMDDEIYALKEKLNKTKSIKQGMMQELLTGKTRLI